MANQLEIISKLPKELVVPVMGSREFLFARSPVYGYITDGMHYLPFFVEIKLGIFKYIVFSNTPFPEMDNTASTEFTAVCIDHLISNKACDFIFQPLSHCVFPDKLPNAINKKWSTPIIRLGDSPENLLKRFHPKHRYEIKKAQKFDYQLVFPDAEELHKLLASNSIDNPNYTYPSLNRLTSLQQSLGDQASIFGIRSAGELVASALIISDHLQGYYVYGGSRKGSVGWMHLLQWEILQIMGRKGIKNYDLVGLRPPEGEDPKYEGLAKFKTRFSPDVINGYTFWVPISPFKVALFRSLLRVRKILTGHEFTL